MMRIYPLRSPVRHGSPCSRGLGIPNTQFPFYQEKLPSNTVPFFIYHKRPSQSKFSLVKLQLITEIYLECRSYDPVILQFFRLYRVSTHFVLYLSFLLRNIHMTHKKIFRLFYILLLRICCIHY